VVGVQDRDPGPDRPGTIEAPQQTSSTSSPSSRRRNTSFDHPGTGNLDDVLKLSDLEETGRTAAGANILKENTVPLILQ